MPMVPKPCGMRQMAQFRERMAFGDEPTMPAQQLVDLAYASKQKDIVVGSVVLESHITPLPDGGSILTLHDVTDRVNDLRERERAEERIRAIAMQDGLTGLPNRLAFNAYLDNCLDKAGRDGSQVALLLFDFNRFKEVNDLFGHAAGDHILRQAAAQIVNPYRSRILCPPWRRRIRAGAAEQQREQRT